MKSAPLGPDGLLSRVSTLGSPTSPSFDPWCFPGADCFASMTRGPPGPEAQSTFKLGSETLDIIQPEAPKFLLLIEFFLPETLRPKIEEATALLRDVSGEPTPPEGTLEARAQIPALACPQPSWKPCRLSVSSEPSY